jgi:hypothetical protein
MINTMWTKAASAVFALAAGGAVAVLSPASPAVAFYSGGLFLDVVPQSPATMVAKGAAVDIPVEVTCNSPTASLHVAVTQSVNHKIATGDGFAEVGCTGAHQRVLIRVTAQGNRAFTTGTALATAEVFGCNNVLCGQETGSTSVKIKR